ncbi:MAG: hypothetical protein R3C10_23540 [Pirellulales bacterium]
MIEHVASMAVTVQSTVAKTTAESACQYLEELLDAIAEGESPCDGLFQRLLCNDLQSLYDCLANDTDLKTRGDPTRTNCLAKIERMIEQAESMDLSTTELFAIKSQLVSLHFCVTPA